MFPVGSSFVNYWINFIMLHVRSIPHAHILPLAVLSRFFFISSHSVFPAKTTATKHMPSTSHSLARRHCCRCESVNIKGQWHEATMIQEIVNKKRSWIFAVNLTHNHFFSFYYGFVEYPLILLIIRVNEWGKVATFPVPLLLPECLLIT